MKKFQANMVTDSIIELKTANDIESVSECINEEENFILQWIEDDKIKSEVMISNNLTPKLKNGDLKLTAMEENKK